MSDTVKDLIKEHETNLLNAKNEDAKAQFNLALDYDLGRGTNVDKEQTFYWYKKSAENGYLNAKTNLSWCYAKGEGTLQDYEKAFYWAKQASEEGDAEAKENLGMFYYRGLGVSKNIEKAKTLWEESAYGGVEIAKTYLNKYFTKEEEMEKTNDSMMGKLLKSGDRYFSAAISSQIAIAMLLIVCGFILISISNMEIEQNLLGYNYPTKNPYANVLLYMGIVLIAGTTIETIVKCYCISSTKINVYESGIDGVGVGKHFSLGAYSTKNFILKYEQITSVDTSTNSITIHASGMQYKCYSGNILELQKIIFERQSLNK